MEIEKLSLPIVQVSTHDMFGGAEKIAWDLFQTYRKRGFKSWLLVGYKHSNNPHVFQLPNNARRKLWARLWRVVGQQFSPFVSRVRGMWQIQNLLYGIGRPKWWFDIQKGFEDFDFPGTAQLMNLLPQQPRVVHCHNLHGGYFDLRILPWLSHQAFVFLTLHDAWLLSGHCAHSFGCERWRIGCGECPDLKLYPAVPRDATAQNWQRKQAIFSQSRLYVATPSQWLMQKVQQSILASAIVEARVIHNGVDMTLFHPADRQTVRAELNLAPDAKILLFAANNVKRNPYKDYQTIRTSIAKIAEHCPTGQNILFISLGGDTLTEHIGPVEVRSVPYQTEPKLIAHYYQAADVYIHAAHVDTFPNTILESLACGTPVVATAVGGIPEQIKSLSYFNETNHYPSSEATGILIPPRDATTMAEAIMQLLNDVSLCRQLGENAAKDAQNRFNLERQVDMYLNWYGEMIQKYKGSVP